MALPGKRMLKAGVPEWDKRSGIGGESLKPSRFLMRNRAEKLWVKRLTPGGKS